MRDWAAANVSNKTFTRYSELLRLHVAARRFGADPEADRRPPTEYLRGNGASALLATGLRRGELLALRWQDLDFEKNSLRVEQALEETTTRGGLIAKAPKTKTSKRTVSLPLSSVALLREHRKVQQERQLALGSVACPRMDRYSPTGTVRCARPAG